jgi:hypothetical protein
MQLSRYYHRLCMICRTIALTRLQRASSRAQVVKKAAQAVQLWWGQRCMPSTSDGVVTHQVRAAGWDCPPLVPYVLLRG